MNQHPLGHNYQWVVSKDHAYSPRGLTRDLHDVLVTMVVAQDRHLSALPQTMDRRVALSVLLGVRTLHVRIYDLAKAEKSGHVDLPSRTVGTDPATYVGFNEAGGVDVITGVLRERLRGQMPLYYADRRLSPQQLENLDRLQTQFDGRIPQHLIVPRAAAPLEEDEDLLERPSPTLEPEPLHPPR